MLKEYQVTLMCASGKYRPVSCIVRKDTDAIVSIGKKEYVKQIRDEGINKICQKRYWSGSDLKKYEYTTCKIREYDKEKIDAENKARYESIKEAKYASGEWKRPKGKDQILA